jgi:hypothetical protein
MSPLTSIRTYTLEELVQRFLDLSDIEEPTEQEVDQIKQILSLGSYNNRLGKIFNLILKDINRIAQDLDRELNYYIDQVPE